MRIIFVKENQKDEWDEFIASNPNGSFLQSWAWGAFQEAFGRKVWRLAAMENNEIMSAALIIKHSLLFGWSYFYCPRGLISQKFIKSPNQSFQDATGQAKVEPARNASPAPARNGNDAGERQIDSSYDGEYSDAGGSQNSIELFFEGVKKMAEKEKAIFLRVDPITSCHCERSSNGARPAHICYSVAGGQSRNLTKRTGLSTFGRSAVGGLRRPAGLLAMTARKNSELLLAITHKTKPTQPQHTLILDITKGEEEILARMKQKTRYNIRLAEKKGVKIKKISQPNDQEIQTFLNLSAQTSERDKFQIHPKEYYQKMLKILCVNSMAKLFFAEYQNKIIAANIVIFFSNKAVYLHGASSNIYRQAMAPYLLHWEQIKEAKKLSCQSYDFWGIETSQKSIKLKVHKVKSSWAGITRFKKGFGGKEISYPESWDVVFKQVPYAIYRIARKII